MVVYPGIFLNFFLGKYKLVVRTVGAARKVNVDVLPDIEWAHWKEPVSWSLPSAHSDAGAVRHLLLLRIRIQQPQQHCCAEGDRSPHVGEPIDVARPSHGGVHPRLSDLIYSWQRSCPLAVPFPSQGGRFLPTRGSHNGGVERSHRAADAIFKYEPRTHFPLSPQCTSVLLVTRRNLGKSKFMSFWSLQIAAVSEIP